MIQSPLYNLTLALNPSLILTAQNLSPDPWQKDLLDCPDQYILLNCSRQSGKSTTVAALAVHTAIFYAGSLILILSPGLRQSTELFRKVKAAYAAIRRPINIVTENQSTLELDNNSRIVCLPGKSDTIRNYSSVALLIIDEAARVSDDLYHSVRPMLAVSNGRLIALSTPFGQRGWFHDEWTGTNSWKRIQVTWKDCPRISEKFLETELNSMGEAWIAQEYNCLFTALSGLVYPDFHTTSTNIMGPPGKLYGGLDFGFRNPFAAIWGPARDDTLYIENEIYIRETPISEIIHQKKLPKATTWYADPAGAAEISQLRIAGYKVLKGKNDLRAGIGAVTARISAKRLMVNEFKCPNLWSEAKMYRYPRPDEGSATKETPIDDHNHALGALRYLISRLDATTFARLLRQSPDPQPQSTTNQGITETAESLYNARLEDPDIWTTL